MFIDRTQLLLMKPSGIDRKGLIKVSAYSLVVFLSVFSIYTFVSNALLARADSAIIWTDKLDYSPEETVLIFGSGFSPSTPLSVILTRPSDPPTTESCDSSYCDSRFLNGPLTSFSDGTFSNYNYLLDGIEGLYTIDINDGLTSAHTSFTDTPPSYNVDTYQSDYSTSKSTFLQEEIVYGKGVRSGGGSEYLGLRYYDSTSSLVKTCNSTGKTTDLTCDYSLPSDALTGTWQIKFYASSKTPLVDGDLKKTENFTVVQCITNGNCNDQNACTDDVCNAQNQCVHTNNNDDCGICAVCSGGSCVADLTQNNDCGFCQKCTAKDTCGFQTSNEDLKGQCPSSDCVTGFCNEAGSCGVKAADTSCDDGLFCNVGETCNGAGICTGGSAKSCSANDITGIATCDNNPDSNSFTFDFRNPFTSICDENTDSCPTEDTTITHTCNVNDCDADCDATHVCSSKCVGDIRNYDGQCTGDCTCSYTTEDCSAKNGWYDTGNTQWIDTGQCTEKEQKEQENREYSCDPAGCQYTIIGDTQWIDTGNTRNKQNGIVCNDGSLCTVNDQCNSGVCQGSAKDCSDGVSCTIDSCDENNGECVNSPDNSLCSNGLFCDGQEYCDATLDCQAGTSVSCSANDILGIAMCGNDPDNNPFTYDSRSSFTSSCDENTDSCTTGNIVITHICNVNDCSAQCEVGNSQPCTTGNGYAGTQDCSGSCVWNSCNSAESCSDGIKNGPEVCDSDSQSCTTNLGYAGTKLCLADCSGYGTCTSTEFCGDSTVNGLENCDDGSNNAIYGHCNSDCTGQTQDITNPTASITSPSTDSYLKGLVTITADASDTESGIEKVEFWHGSVGTKIGEDATVPYSIDWDTTVVSDGNHALWIVAYDNDGNYISSDFVDVVVDNTIPAITLTSPDNNVIQKTTTTSHSYKVSDTADQASCTFVWNGPLSGTNSFNGIVSDNSEQSAGSLTSLVDGIYTWYITCTDLAGNTGQSETRTFEIDTIVPSTPQISAPKNGELTDDTTPTIQWSALADSVTYSLQVSDKSDFSNLVVDDSSLIDNSLTTDPLDLGKYFARVRATDLADNTGAFSDTIAFTIGNFNTIESETLAAGTTPVGKAGTLNATFIITTTGPTDIFTAKSDETVPSVSGFLSLGKLVSISAGDESAIQFPVEIRMYYTDAEVSAAGIDESTLRIRYYNSTDSSFEIYDGHDASHLGGVDTAANFVWANVTHFSVFGIFGLPPAPIIAPAIVSAPLGGGLSQTAAVTSSNANVPIATATTTSRVTVTNIGKATLWYPAILVDSICKETVTPPSMDSLKPGDSATFTVDFDCTGVASGDYPVAYSLQISNARVIASRTYTLTVSPAGVVTVPNIVILSAATSGLTPGSTGTAIVTVQNSGNETASGTVVLDVPTGWVVAPSNAVVALEPGETKNVSFDITTPSSAGVPTGLGVLTGFASFLGVDAPSTAKIDVSVSYMTPTGMAVATKTAEVDVNPRFPLPVLIISVAGVAAAIVYYYFFRRKRI